MKKSIILLAIVLICFASCERNAFGVSTETTEGIAASSNGSNIEETIEETEVSSEFPEGVSNKDGKETSKKPSNKQEHKTVKLFSFQFQGSTALSYMKPYCEHPGHIYPATCFRGTPNDLSYLEVLKDHSNSDEIVWGEYYTITAIVTIADHDIFRTRVNCKVESEDIIVGFSVEFREEFEESVALYDTGDEITFRGRFYDEGCGFTDCELITD